MDLSIGPRQPLPEPVPSPTPSPPPPRPGATPSEPAGLACRPIGRLQRDEVVILLYELSDRGTGALRGYQSVVLSNRVAAHA